MKYNIDTKENFDIITPISTTLDTDLVSELTKATRNSKSQNQSVILNFENITESAIHDNQFICILHDEMYDQKLSFVLCQLHEKVKNLLDLDDHKINITPKLIEAIDIVSMEALERELMGDDVFDEGEDYDF